MKKQTKTKVHLRKRYSFGYGYACIQAIGKGNKDKMTPYPILVTCKSCKARYCIK